MLDSPSILVLDREVQAVLLEDTIDARNVGLDASCDNGDHLDTERCEFDAERVAVGVQRRFGSIVC